MNLVAGNRGVGQDAASPGRADGFLRNHRGIKLEQAQPVHRSARAVHSARIVDATAQHLESAAQPQYPAAASDVGHDVMLPALGAQKGQIADGRFGAEQDDDIHVTRNRSSGRHKAEIDLRLQAQRVGVVKVGDAGQHWGGDPHPSGLCRVELGQRYGVFGRQTRGGRSPGDEAKARPAGALLNDRNAGLEQARLTPELVDRKADDQGAVRRVEHGLGADQGRDNAPAINVADQTHRGVHAPGEAHVGNIASPQVDLGRAARPLDDDQLVRRHEPAEAVQDGAHQALASGRVVRRVQCADRPAVDYDLRAPVGVRFQQHRIEIGVRRQPGRPSLYSLGTANLSAVGTRGRVIGHVLGFEGRNAQPPPPGDATQTGDDNGFTDIRAGPLDHDDPRAHTALCLSQPPRPVRPRLERRSGVDCRDHPCGVWA